MFEPNLQLGQHFLIDKDAVVELASLANLTAKDNVLEIGAGTGVLTKELASKAGCVVAIEIDERLEPVLKKELSGFKNVKTVFGDAFAIAHKVPHKGKYERFNTNSLNDFVISGVKINKIVANMPYHMCEPLMHGLLFPFDYEVAVWLAPQGFIKTLDKPIPKSLLDVQLGCAVSSGAFSPLPRTKSQMVIFKPKKAFDFSSEKGLYVAKCLYLLEPRKLKNALREGLISLYHAMGKVLTKREARDIVKSFKLSKDLLETKPHNMSEEEYRRIIAEVDRLTV